MDTQLILLLEIQEVRAKARELRAGNELSEMEQRLFGMDPETAAAALDARVGELEKSLSERIRRRYEAIAGHLDRVVVPVIGGTCYGCFVSIPTATAGDRDRNANLRTCETCGRFIYIVD